jgi:hypothetical protein
MALMKASTGSAVLPAARLKPPTGKEATMWGWLKDAAKKLQESGVSYMQHRTFILSLFHMAPQQAYWVLKQKIDEMDEAAIQSFSATLSGMMVEAQQATQQTSFDSWGVSSEDRIAQGMAEIQAGFPSSQSGNQPQGYLQGLQYIAYYANQFYQEKQSRASQPPGHPLAAPVAAPGGNRPDTAEIGRMIDNLVQTGHLDPALLQRLGELNDEATIDIVTAKLQAAGAHEGASPPLNSADYYRPGTEKYRLKWLLPPAISLPVPFDQLDRPTQFHVLFSEWSRRVTEGYQLLYAGETTAAQTVFAECLQRAEQIDVAELKARSYEGSMKAAQKFGDPQATRRWLNAALGARKQGQG